jgi:hypothetical protein
MAKKNKKIGNSNCQMMRRFAIGPFTQIVVTSERNRFQKSYTLRLLMRCVRIVCANFEVDSIRTPKDRAPRVRA